jgi:hypothetical protein
MSCVTSEQYNEQASDPIFVHFFQAREKNQCCSCNTTSETYNNYGNFMLTNINSNTCKADGYVDYVVTGLMCFIFTPLLFAILYLICYIFFVTSKKIYNCTKTQWKEYIDKKIDSNIQNQYNLLDIKNSNIIYQDDIELGKHFQHHETIKENEIDEFDSDANSTKSEDGILINISDTEGYSIIKK